MNSVSIIICFYNAASRIVNTLEAIKKLEIPSSIKTELILVNNNSNDNTEDLINEILREDLPFSWKIVQEKTPGLSNARKCGVFHAQNEILLFCDDDNWLDKDYLTRGISILQKYPTIAVLGGKGEAISDISLPEWFNNVQNFYAVGPQMPQTGEVKVQRNIVYGAGMMIPKAYWNRIFENGFDFFGLGRTGKKLSSGEDAELCLAFKIAGYKIWYDESLTFKHYIEPKRLDSNYFKKLQKGISNSGFVTRFYRDYLFGYRPNVTSKFWFKEVLYLLKDAIISFNFELIKRNLNVCKYILKNPKKYVQDVSRIIKTSDALKQLQLTNNK